MLIGTWWILWLGFFLVLLVLPMGYGWGYRDWGPPFPTYWQRRRSAQLAAKGVAGPFKHESWSWGGDLFWLAVFVCATSVIWAMWLPLWPRR
jgi:hypothetical protein